MHSAALHLAPILAEKSRTPFFVAGGLLAAWALIVSLGLGLRHPAFPASIGGERGVIAISIVLVLSATSTAVITSGSAAKASSAPATPAGSAAPPATGPSTTGAPTSGTTSTGAAPGSTASTPASAPPGGATATTSLSLAASSTAIAYNTKQLSAKAGTVKITFTNPGPLEHNVTIAQGSTTLGATPTITGGSKSLALKLNPGTYTFFCTVPGHRAAGMEGTLTVT
jgi:plastocyanin